MRIVVGLLVAALLSALVADAWLVRELLERLRSSQALRLDPVDLDFYPAGAGHDAPEPRVVVFGDSRAHAWTPPEDSVGFAFVNRGIGGQTTGQALARFDHHVAPLEPHVVLIQLGVNDLRQISFLRDRRSAIVANCLANLERIVARARSLGATVVLTTIFPIGEPPLSRRLFFSAPEIQVAIDEVNARLRGLAASDVIVFEGDAVLRAPSGEPAAAYSKDWLHVSPAGYTALNQVLEPVLHEIAAR